MTTEEKNNWVNGLPKSTWHIEAKDRQKRRNEKYTNKEIFEASIKIVSLTTATDILKQLEFNRKNKNFN